jgi:hypothetical protein
MKFSCHKENVPRQKNRNAGKKSKYNGKNALCSFKYVGLRCMTTVAQKAQGGESGK